MWGWTLGGVLAPVGDEGGTRVGTHLKRMHRWKGLTKADLVILRFLMPKPVMARYSSGPEIL